MDQNATKTNHIPDEIRVKKVSKRHEKAAIGLWGGVGVGGREAAEPWKIL